MLKTVGVVIVATCLIGGSAPTMAQSLEIGPDGPRLELRDRGERDHDREYRRDRDREGRYERERGHCRMVERRTRDEDGDIVVTRRRECRD